ncbi:uncharacterized protein LOC136041422 isoform X5 [Artemia franciscana]|uniref:uncharacterized protein LOC136041422 isoform X5 n=1 Tax=Artemia franciscana TaxID=6661 RepID=UPI0032DABF69
MDILLIRNTKQGKQAAKKATPTTPSRRGKKVEAAKSESEEEAVEEPKAAGSGYCPRHGCGVMPCVLRHGWGAMSYRQLLVYYLSNGCRKWLLSQTWLWSPALCSQTWLGGHVIPTITCVLFVKWLPEVVIVPDMAVESCLVFSDMAGGPCHTDNYLCTICQMSDIHLVRRTKFHHRKNGIS